MQLPPLSRREREIMDILYRRGRASAKVVHEEMADPPTYSAVRATLRVLEDKSHVTHQQHGRSYVYSPATAPTSARNAAVDRLVDVFFGGSTAGAILTLIDERAADLSPADVTKIEALIERAGSEGR
jgi:predicted transcriptional regulator